MTTYITNINSGKLKDVLAKLKKEDTLIIFHSSAEKQVPIEMISLFAGAKGKVEFKETEDEIERFIWMIIATRPCKTSREPDSSLSKT